MEGTNASEREMWGTARCEGDVVRSCGESESLSDIDDAEVNSYLYSEKEKHYKKIIWETINQKYLQEQEAKKTAANATKPTKEENRQKRKSGVKKSQSTAETTDPTSPKKKCSSRINYDALSKILGEPVPSDSSKKRKSEFLSDQNTRKNPTDDENGEDNEENDWEEEEPQDYRYHSNQEEDYNFYDDDEF